jgi:general secretion pathway protein M
MKASVWASRSAALAILIGIAAALWLYLFQPLLVSFFDHRESLRQSQEALARYEKLNTSRQELEKTLQQVHATQGSEGRLFMGASTQLVGAAIQNRLKALIEAGGGVLISMQMLPVREEEGFRRVPMSISLRATIESLQPILYAIETNSPYLFIENLEARSNRGIMGAGLPESEESHELEIRFEVYGYMPSDTS